ncbi:hypothetical protein [Methylobacterium sp. CM6247]
MTANAMFVVEDGIVVFSDGAAYDETGTVRQIHDKQLIRADIDTVITCSSSGSGLSLLNLAMSSDAPGGFDDVADQMPGWSQEVHAMMMAAFPERGETENWAMYLYGGWSERAQAWKAFLIITLSGSMLGMRCEAYTPVPLASYVKPEASPEALAKVGLPADLNTLPAPVDPHDLGLRLMMALRHTEQTAIHGPGSRSGYIVGGFLQHTHLRRGRAETRIAYRWPDEIGRPIDPSGDPPFTIEYGTAPASAMEMEAAE